MACDEDDEVEEGCIGAPRCCELADMAIGLGMVTDDEGVLWATCVGMDCGWGCCTMVEVGVTLLLTWCRCIMALRGVGSKGSRPDDEDDDAVVPVG